MITLPNTTRVAGAWLLIKDALRSMTALGYHAFQNTTFGANNLLHDEWK